MQTKKIARVECRYQYHPHCRDTPGNQPTYHSMSNGDGDSGSTQLSPVVPKEGNVIFGKVGKKVIVKSKIKLVVIKELFERDKKKTIYLVVI